MAAKQYLWNVEIDEIPYKIEYVKGKVSINNGEAVSLNKFRHNSKLGSSEIFIPVGDKELVMYSGNFGVVLTKDGKNCLTGEPFTPPVMPKWVWVFVVLYAIDFFALLGGLLGGAINFGAFGLTTTIASSAKTTGKKLALCIGLYVILTVLEFVIALVITNALYGGLR